MGWETSDRRSRLPKDWPAIRRRILRRDGHRCTHTDIYGARCPEPATDVDHLVPGDDNRDANLASKCGYHHDKKSGGEGGAARAAIIRRQDRKFRRSDPHPGIL